MQRVTVEDVSSWSYRGLELFLLVPPVLSALLGLGILVAAGITMGSESAATASTGYGAGFLAFASGITIVWILGIVLGVLSFFAVPIFLYLDAKKVADQDLDWKPEPVLYMVLGVVLSGFAVLHYLYKRHDYVVDWVGSETWWYVTLAGFGIAIVGLVGGVVNPVVWGLPLIALPMITTGIYKDSVYVRLNSDWHPNPVNHFLSALLSAILVIPGILYFGYYVYKRHGALGIV